MLTRVWRKGFVNKNLDIVKSFGHPIWVNILLIVTCVLKLVFEMLSSLRGPPGYQPVIVKKVWTRIYTTISIWSRNNSCAKISLFYTRFGICQKMSTFFLGLSFSGAVCLIKVQQNYYFGFSLFWNLNFDKSKVIVSVEDRNIFGTHWRHRAVPLWMEMNTVF